MRGTCQIIIKKVDFSSLISNSWIILTLCLTTLSHASHYARLILYIIVAILYSLRSLNAVVDSSTRHLLSEEPLESCSTLTTIQATTADSRFTMLGKSQTLPSIIQVI